jgi:uncharacterized membrane protein YhiD involved in acid resistance
MFNLQSTELYAPSLVQTLAGLVVSLLCAVLISVVYRFTYRGPGYSNSFITSIVVLALITSVVIMVIGNNLARAFGLVGALSIIRFRTAVKDTIDIVYIFFALAIGMAAGVGYFKLAVTATVFISLVLLAISKSNIKFLQGEQFLLQMEYMDDDVAAITSVMDDYCSTFELINVKSEAGRGKRDFSYYVTLKKRKDYLEFVSALKKVSAVQSINLFRDEEHI